MPDRSAAGHGDRVALTCEVKIRGRLNRALLAEFEQLGLTADVEPTETVLYGSVEDRAALHGLLRRIEALGLELVEMRTAPHRRPRQRPV